LNNFVDSFFRKRTTLDKDSFFGFPQKNHEIPRMIKLSTAFLCINCDTIFSRKKNKIGAANNYCPSCGSKNTTFVSKFLNRKENNEGIS
jgi:DNA-directed RNA polymerase subunit RPC12/RpoP